MTVVIVLLMIDYNTDNVCHLNNIEVKKIIPMSQSYWTNTTWSHLMETIMSAIDPIHLPVLNFRLAFLLVSHIPTIKIQTSKILFRI